MHIVGPAQGHTGVPYVFSAVITPTAASLPITYTWQPEPMAGQNTPNAAYIWGSVGVYSVSVSVINCQATTSSSRTATASVIPPPAAAAGDAYEADDTCAEASAIEVTGASQVHTLHASADIDWVAFPATAGTTYVIQARVPPTSTADVNLELYEACDGDGRDDQDPTFAADVRVTFRAVRSGDHYLRLRNSDPNVYGSDAVYHLAVQPAQTSANGAVVLVAGKLKDDDPVQPNIHHVTNAVYQLALDNGCTADDVYYLGSDTALPGVDAEATAANLQQAITGWARDRIGAAKRFTLYLMDHGGADTFYLNYVDGQAVTVTPGQLDTWLSQLEGDVPDVEANVIIEACYSGSFIEPEHTVSRSGRERLVMASTGPSALAYATGDGALFSDKFLGELARGDSLQLAFEESRWAALQAHADQTPWLDVDGDGTPNEAEDMAIARARGFACAAVPTVEKWAPYISNVWVRTLSDGNIGIWAKAQDDKDATGLGVKDVWAVVYPPSYTPPSQSEELVQEADLGLPPLPMLATNTDDLYGTFYPAFSETGIYRVVIHAVDEEGLVARPQVVEVQSGQPQHWVYLPLVLKQD
jgi:PKD repeat protein